MLFIPLVLIILMLANGCTKEVSPQVGRVQTLYNATVGDNALDISDIRAFADRRSTITKTNGEPGYTMEPYCGSDGEPLVYIVNYGKGDGWQILSTDARTPAVIAEGDSGYFSLEDGSPAVRVWLDCMAADIAAVKRASDDQLNFSEEEIAAHRAVWGKEVSKEPVQGDRLPGHWVVDLVGTQEMVGDTLAHMTPKWHQEAPYNTYCPLKSNSTTERAPAGCVAVAAAEALYCLHNRLGSPTDMMSQGYCDGNVNNYYRLFWNPNNTIWSQMDSIYKPSYMDAIPESILIGYVGQLVRMDYGDTASGAHMEHIQDYVLDSLHISSWYGNYAVDSVKRNLNHYLPVIVSATDWLIPLNNHNHCFVIDGYKKTFTRKTYYHHWETNDPTPIDPRSGGNHDPYYTYEDTTPEITSIRINWGWESQWCYPFYNEGWYSLTADWAIDDGGAGYNYNYNVKMICDMAAITPPSL